MNALEKAGIEPEEVVDLQARLDDRDQRDHRAPRGEDRAGHHQGLPRRARRRAAPTAPTSSTPTGTPRPPLVPRRHILEARERVDYEGNGARASSNEDDVREAARKFKLRGIESVAVAYINSFMRPDHERRTKEILLEELGDGAFVCTSSEILPEIREFERTSTVAANAYLMPVIERYIDSLVERPARVGLRGRGLRHPLGRRRRDRPRRAQRARPHLPLGPRRRRRRRAARRRARRLRERDHLRHGRHERRPRARARAASPTLAPGVAGRLEHPDPLPRHRPGRDRRGRRHDRLGRHRRLAARRAPERRRRSRSRPASARATSEPTITDAHLYLGRLNPDELPRRRPRDPARSWPSRRSSASPSSSGSRRRRPPAGSCGSPTRT